MHAYQALLALAVAMPTGSIAGHCGGAAMHYAALADLQQSSPEELRGAQGVAPQPRSVGAQLLMTYCNQCHGLPSPAQHDARAWAAVASRMYEHMQAAAEQGGAVRAPSATELAHIIAYLQDNASTD